MNGGTLNIESAVTGTGAGTISSNGILEFQANVGPGQTITFADATGTLKLADPADFHAAVAGFGGSGWQHDRPDECHLLVERDRRLEQSNNTLTVSNGTQTEVIHLSGTYTQSDFALASDGSTANAGNPGTDIVWSPATGSVSDLDSADNAVEGNPVTANLNGETGDHYTWLDNGSVVGSGASYTPQSTDVGNALDVVIGFTNGSTAEQITELAGTVVASPVVSFNTASPASTDENAALTLSTLNVSFADAGSDTVTAALNLAANGDTAHGMLTFGGSPSVTTLDGATITNNGSADVTLTGTLTEIDNALVSGFTYTPNAGFLGTDTLTFSASDAATGGTFASNTATLGITVVADHWANSSGGDWSTGVDWSFGSAPSSGIDAVIDASGGYTVTISSSDTDVANSLTITAAGAGADVQDETGGSLTLTGALTIDAGSFSLIGGSLSTASIYVGSSGYFIAEGAVSAPIDNNGGIVQADGNLSLSGAVTGAGTFEVNGHTLDFGNSVAGGTVDFGASAGTLQLDQPASFGASISNFGAGDTVDLTSIGYSPTAYAVWTQTSTTNGGSGTLAIYNASGTPEASLNLNGIYTQNEFALASDGSTVNNGNPGTAVDFNYVSFTNGQINQESSQYDHYTPQVSHSGNSLQLTNDNPTEAEAASWFANSQVSVSSNFTASFDYQATPSGGGLADGFAFILQNSSAGLGALGADGGEFGYGPNNAGDGRGGTAISPSAAIEFNLYSGHAQGTAFATDGSTGSYNETGGVDFWDTGDTIQVVLSYNGSSQILAETLTDTVTGATYATTYSYNLPSILGSNTAYVGFSAGNGGGSSTQAVSNFTLADLTAGTVTASGGVEYTTATTLAATFTDANLAASTGDFSGTINWGDGTTTTFTSNAVSGSNGAFTVNGSHQYAEEGSYSVSVAINDIGGSTTTDTGSTTVADAPLTAGTVTASGGVEYTTAATLSATFTDANPVHRPATSPARSTGATARRRRPSPAPRSRAATAASR